uniref:RRM domain-containing protein n=1 Tax=Panagrolaimus sp. JU765 TaxID=591449 RepID=A0AC34QLB9_9BILA
MSLSTLKTPKILNCDVYEKCTDSSDGDSGRPSSPLTFIHESKNRYSRKVFVGGLPFDITELFVGGLPFDITERDLQKTFGRFGILHIDWPRRQDVDKYAAIDPPTTSHTNRRQSSGYVFIIYRKESSVRKLLNECFIDNKRYFIELPTKTNKKSVQIRPWLESDCYYFWDKMDLRETYLNPRNAVFIGGVPRPTRAVDIVKAIESTYGTVVYASIDTDPELRYPKGAARVIFDKRADYEDAMTRRNVDLENGKRVEIKPYVIDDQPCDVCHGRNNANRPAPYFCGESTCLQYFCENCWDFSHDRKPMCAKLRNHTPYVRSGDSTRQLGTVPHRAGATTYGNGVQQDFDKISICSTIVNKQRRYF